VHRLRFGHLGRDEPGILPVAILDLQRGARASVGQAERAGLAIVDPLIGQWVAVGISCVLGTEIDTFARFRAELAGVIQFRYGRVVGLGVGLIVQSCAQRKSF